MSIKNRKTTTSYLSFDDLRNLIHWMENEARPLDEKGKPIKGKRAWMKIALIAAIGGYCGLRLSDILPLKWVDILENDVLFIVEKKTSKTKNQKNIREIYIHPELKKIVQKALDLVITYNGNLLKKKDEVLDINKVLQQQIFMNTLQKDVFTPQYINRKLKEAFILCNPKIHYLKEGNVSTHVFRKTWARHCWTNENKNLPGKSMSDERLLYVSMALGHSSVAMTRIYLGIQRDTIKKLYMYL